MAASSTKEVPPVSSMPTNTPADARGQEPLFVQVKRRLRGEIADGRLPAGQRLAPERGAVSAVRDFAEYVAASARVPVRRRDPDSRWAPRVVRRLVTGGGVRAGAGQPHRLGCRGADLAHIAGCAIRSAPGNRPGARRAGTGSGGAGVRPGAGADCRWRCAVARPCLPAGIARAGAARRRLHDRVALRHTPRQGRPDPGEA